MKCSLTILIDPIKKRSNIFDFLKTFLVRPHPVRDLHELDVGDGPADDADQVPDSGGRHLQALPQPVLRRHRRLPRQSCELTLFKWDYWSTGRS
jgi:hypothetical protein